MIVIRNSVLRRVLNRLLPFLLIPVTVIAGSVFFQGKQYILVSLMVAVWSILLFVTGFERKQIGSRRLVLTSVMTALSVVSRFIPRFKPVAALTILGGMYLGPEAGFLIGAISALLSNFYFGQGPWTPFQMFAWGMIGFTAGLLAHPLRRSRIVTVLFGLVAGAAFSLIMDVWTTLWIHGQFNPALYLGAVLTALPHTLVYMLSNALFLFLFYTPFSEKLERICLKYGL